MERKKKRGRERRQRERKIAKVRDIEKRCRERKDPTPHLNGNTDPVGVIGCRPYPHLYLC